MTPAPLVSVIVPCRNEGAHIRRMLSCVLRSDYPRDRLEVIFVDGLSHDGTREALQRAAAEHPFIKVADNPHQTTPAALNIGLGLSRGEVIVRMDAHNAYPPDYVTRCVRLLADTGAGCAGGRSISVPNGDSPWARAVAAVTMHAFGVGNSTFRVSDKPGFVDTVPCGTFPRAVLTEVGPYDERLTRNQDNELAARIRRSGYKIAFDPTIRLEYYNHPDLYGLARQGFHNGMWNAYTVVLHPYTWRARHFVPALFVFYLYFTAAAMAFAAERGLWPVAIAPLAAYAALILVGAATAGREGGGAWRVAITTIYYHVAYGAGTHVGLVNLLTGRWREQLGKPLKK